MGCGDACPVFPANATSTGKLEDPSGKTIEEVRPIRDELETQSHGLLLSCYLTAPSADRHR